MNTNSKEEERKVEMAVVGSCDGVRAHPTQTGLPERKCTNNA